MGFLDQLKSQAAEIKSQQSDGVRDVAANTARTEAAFAVVVHYLRDLAPQLTVLEPSGPRLTLDGKTPWPAMKLTRFHSDARKKMLRDKEVYHTASMGWVITPKLGVPVGGVVNLTFLPDVDKVQAFLNQASVKYERKEQRHPERKAIQAVRFEYTTEAKGHITVTADHDAGQLSFRLANVQGFGVTTHVFAAERVNSSLMDELAKLLLGHSSTFA